MCKGQIKEGFSKIVEINDINYLKRGDNIRD